MCKVTLDDELRARLNGLNEELEICEADGRTVGHFVPSDVYRQLLYAWVESQSGITEEELQRRIGEETDKGRTLAEIWKDLGVQ